MPIELIEAVKDYGGKKIGPANLAIKKGEVVGFLGPNGSGKTTCIRLLLGLIRPTQGQVRVNGLDPIKHHVEALRNVAYSPELPNIQTFLSPKELLNLVSHELYFADNQTRNDDIRHVLETVGLQEYANTKVGKLSKGMVQRLSVAQALLGKPEILILDEPMIGLDPAGVAHFRDVFRDFAKDNGGTVFLSSHIMSEVESLCTSVAIIHKGKILHRGSAQEVEQKILNYSLIQLETSPLSAETLLALQQISGVDHIETKNSSMDIVTVEIAVNQPAADFRPEIADLVIRSGAKLYTIKPAENMLERAYIQALKNGGEVK